MDEATPDGGIGTGIAKVLEAASKELVENEAVDTDLDDLCWSSVNANAAACAADSLDNTFYHSIAEDENWAPKQQSLSALDPPNGEPVVAGGPVVAGDPVGAGDPAAFDKDAAIDQVAEFAVREVERLTHRSTAASNQQGDVLLFTNGNEGVYVGGSGQYATLYDNPKESMKGLLNMFYRGNRQELEQVAQHIIDNAVKGTPVDIREWINK
jgi:hypothetical protein